jgi:hypothetical protein
MLCTPNLLSAVKKLVDGYPCVSCIPVEILHLSNHQWCGSHKDNVDFVDYLCLLLANFMT